jgi:AmmeMemoRadiSam system protein B
MIRHPAVAGTFYSDSPEVLRADVARYCVADVPPKPAIATISPHAGLRYSGHVAGAVFSRIIFPQTVILIGPNHTGLGPPISVFPEGIWLIPGDEVPVASGFVDDLLSRFPEAKADTDAHLLEHCLEVQLPFLLKPHRRGLSTGPHPSVQIVPIVLQTTRQEVCRDLGRCLADLLQERTSHGHGPVLILASTDMSHYDSERRTREKDRYALDAIARLDPESLEQAAKTYDITMCGLGPTMAVLHAARELGATGASLVRYATSGEISGDYDRVVGYAGFTIS